MQSYIEHVKKLRAMYKIDSDSGSDEPTVTKKAEKPVVVAGGRKIAKAHRRNGSTPVAPKVTETPKSNTVSSIFAASSPANTAAVPKFGDISMIGKDTPAPIIKKPSVVEKVPEAAEPVVQAPATARKRAIRGGGPLGGSESVIFKGGQGEETKCKLSFCRKIQVYLNSSLCFYYRHSTNEHQVPRAKQRLLDEEKRFAGRQLQWRLSVRVPWQKVSAPQRNSLKNQIFQCQNHYVAEVQWILVWKEGRREEGRS